MNISIQEYGARNYLFVNDNRVKMIPKHYQGLWAEKIHSCIVDPKKMMLTKVERKALNVHLVKHLIDVYVEEICKNEKYVYELIKDSEPQKVLLVNTNIGEHRYEIKFKNGVRIKCSSNIYSLFEPKEIIFSNY